MRADTLEEPLVKKQVTQGDRISAVYVRVSTGEQAKKGFSLQDQEATLTALARARGWSAVEVYKDAGISGETLEGRPSLKRLLRDVDAGRVARVLVVDLSRLSRADRVKVEILDRLDRAGVLIETPGGTIDPEQPESMFAADVLFAVAKLDQRMRAKKSRASRRRAAEDGYYPAGPAPFGYRIEDRRLVANDEPWPKAGGRSEADVVRLMFELCAKERLSPYKIAERLDKLRIPTAALWPGRTGQGRHWSHMTVRRMLRNPLYLGRAQFGKRRYAEPSDELVARRVRLGLPVERKVRVIADDAIEVTAPALVTRAVYERAGRALGPSTPGRTAKIHYFELARGLLVCGRCGRNYYGIVRSAGARYRFYWCAGRHHQVIKDERCTSPNFRADRLEDLVWSTVVALLREPGLLESAFVSSKGRRSSRRETAELEDKLAALQERGDRYARMLADGIDEARVTRLLRELEDGERGLRRKLAHARARKDGGDAWQAMLAAVHAASKVRRKLENATPEQRRDVYDRLGARVLVRSDDGEPVLELAVPFGAELVEDVDVVDEDDNRYVADAVDLPMPVTLRESPAALDALEENL